MRQLMRKSRPALVSVGIHALLVASLFYFGISSHPEVASWIQITEAEDEPLADLILDFEIEEPEAQELEVLPPEEMPLVIESPDMWDGSQSEAFPVALDLPLDVLDLSFEHPGGSEGADSGQGNAGDGDGEVVGDGALSDDQGSSSGGFFGIPVEGKTLVFALDYSGSMNTVMGYREYITMRHTWINRAGSLRERRTLEMRYPHFSAYQFQLETGRTTRLKRAKRELIETINGLPNDTSFAILLFYKKIVELEGGFRVANRENKQEAVQWLENITEGIREGGSMCLPLEHVVKWDLPKGTQIYLLADGIDPDASMRRVDKISNRLSTQKNATVHAIGLDDASGNQLLSTIAAKTGGQFRFIDR